MGMYTEFHFNAEVQDDDDVLAVLRYMVDDGPEPAPLPNHLLFSTGRWRRMLRGDSYYFDADTHSTLRADYQGGQYLCIRCNLKNYDGEIEKFIDWITPHLKKHEGDFLGFYRYEETEQPTLIHHSPASTQEGEYARNQQEAVEHIRTLPPSERSAVANRPGQAPPSTHRSQSGGAPC